MTSLEKNIQDYACPFCETTGLLRFEYSEEVNQSDDDREWSGHIVDYYSCQACDLFFTEEGIKKNKKNRDLLSHE